MLLTSASTVPDDQHVTNGASARNGGAIAADLAARVRFAFPDLHFSAASVEERGGDHRVLLLDTGYAFRFPRATTHGLDLEIVVLRGLRGRCDIAVPEYRFVDPAGHFAGYRFIAGDELTPRRFGLLTAAIRRRVLEQAGEFLAILHGLAPAEVLSLERWPRLGTAAHHAEHARIHRLPRILDAFPQLAGPLDAFYEDRAGDGEDRRAVLHGDLVDDHLLLAPDGGGLAGIIDFADVALGDPAQDMMGFWAYGPDAVARVMTAYGAGGDHALRARSLRAFIRYRVDRFSDLLAADGEAVAARSLPGLIELVAASRQPVTPSDFHQYRSTEEMTMNDPISDDRQPGAGSAFSQFDASAGEQAGAAAASIKDAAGNVSAAASDQASSLVGQVKDKAAAAVSGQKEGLADRIDDLADAVHKSGAQFEGKQDWIAGAVERGATELGAVATALRDNDLASLIGQVQTIARRQPALFIGASLAAGFAIARLGKLVVADVSRDDLPTLPEVGHGE